jgi:putative transcriptional regulator
MIDLNVYNKLEPQKGRLLLTEPFEESEYFQRSVIVLCEHNEDGTFGFVLNNYVDIDLSDFDEMPEFDTRLSLGGPVNSKNLYYIHTLGDRLDGSILIHDNIYAGGDFNTLKDLMREGEVGRNEVRFFLGYSGWVQNQLNGEIMDNAWLVVDIETTEQIMDIDNEELWSQLMKKQGGKYKAFAHFPKNPELN